MSAIKTALKAAKGALDAHQYDKAVENATEILKEDPKNYHAYVRVAGGTCSIISLISAPIVVMCFLA